VIVWLWDAPGALSAACGVSSDHDSARQAATTCLASGDATAATLQAAELVNGADALDPHYARFGFRWQATRTRGGAVHWCELPGSTQPDPPPPTEFGNRKGLQ
jgi:hypothetical protein